MSLNLNIVKQERELENLNVIFSPVDATRACQPLNGGRLACVAATLFTVLGEATGVELRQRPEETGWQGYVYAARTYW
jgi:hypothetical protein